MEAFSKVAFLIYHFVLDPNEPNRQPNNRNVNIHTETVAAGTILFNVQFFFEHI